MPKRIQRAVKPPRKELGATPFSDDCWSGKDAVPFLALPSWWRGFLFRVLDGLDLAVYCYLCSLMGSRPVAYPELDRIQGAVNRSANPVRASIKRLHNLWFIRYERNGDVTSRADPLIRYQRPRAITTVIHLLADTIIDDNLIFIPPTKHNDGHGVREVLVPASKLEPVVARGLEKVMGGTLYDAYKALRVKLAQEPYRPLRINALIAVLAARQEFVFGKETKPLEVVISAKEKLKAVRYQGRTLSKDALDAFR